MPMGPPQAEAPTRRWRNRIVGHREEQADQLLANPRIGGSIPPTNGLLSKASSRKLAVCVRATQVSFWRRPSAQG